MNQQMRPTTPTDAEFNLRVRQAILVAQSSARQFGLLLIRCSGTFDETAHIDDTSCDLEGSLFMQVHNSLRDSDTIMQFSEHVLGGFPP